jgi:hypothetical protein
MKGRSWRIDCPLVLAACHKLGQGDRVRSLHEFSKSASVGEGQGRTKALLDFLCIRPNESIPWLFVYLDRQGASVFHLQPSPNRSLDKASLCMAHLSTHLALLQATCCHTETGLELFAVEHNWCHTSSFCSCTTYLEAQVSCLHVNPNFAVGKKLFNEN